jgi:hypothetical protein
MASKSRSTKGAARRDDRSPANIVEPVKAVRRRRGERAPPSVPPFWSTLAASLRLVGGRLPPAPAERPVLTAGALPTGLAEQYHAQPGLLRRHIDYYEGDVAKRPVFRDRGGKLIAYQLDPTTIASLLSIAQHRRWQELQVAGDRPFRRAVWLEATRAGLTVTGYRPSARDRDAATPLEALSPEPSSSEPAKRSSARSAVAGRDHAAPRPPITQSVQDFHQGVAGLFVAHGQAPYQNQVGGKPSPFLRVDIGAAKPFEIWGVDFTKTLQDANIKAGDAVTLSWHGADYGDIRVHKAKVASPEPRPDPAATTQHVTGADRVQAAGDPDRPSARGRLAVVEAVARAKLDRPKDRAQIGAAAKAILAKHLSRGSDFTLPTVAERSVRPGQDLGQKPSRPSSRERDR